MKYILQRIFADTEKFPSPAKWAKNNGFGDKVITKDGKLWIDDKEVMKKYHEAKDAAKNKTVSPQSQPQATTQPATNTQSQPQATTQPATNTQSQPQTQSATTTNGEIEPGLSKKEWAKRKGYTIKGDGKFADNKAWEEWKAYSNGGSGNAAKAAEKSVVEEGKNLYDRSKKYLSDHKSGIKKAALIGTGLIAAGGGIYATKRYLDDKKLRASNERTRARFNKGD